MNKVLNIGYVRPSAGGIADYARQIESIYKMQGHNVTIITVDRDVQLPADELLSLTADVFHFEVGAGDSKIFKLSEIIRKHSKIPQIVTVHDPGVVVWRPVDVGIASSSNRWARFGGKVVRKLLGKSVGKQRIRRYLQAPNRTKIYLRANLANNSSSFYLPQPTYHQTKPKSNFKSSDLIGFSGYWGPGKGIETLLEAWGLLAGRTPHKLVVAGSTASPSDSYAATIRERIASMEQTVKTPGFIDASDLDAFLKSLAAIVLPYWPDLPNGTSAMAMRAAELAVPIIASDVPALRDQLGKEGAIYVPARDASALAATIESFSTDDKRHRDNARRTQNRIFSDHSWTVVGQKLDDILAEVTAK